MDKDGYEYINTHLKIKTSYFFVFGVYMQVVKLLSTACRAYSIISTASILSSSPFHGSRLISGTNPTYIASVSPQQLLPDIMTPIIPPKNPAPACFLFPFPRVIPRKIHASTNRGKPKITISDNIISVHVWSGP